MNRARALKHAFARDKTSVPFIVAYCNPYSGFDFRSRCIKVHTLPTIEPCPAYSYIIPSIIQAFYFQNINNINLKHI